jgi:DNA (cytosine-5)-methyltransferase 3A
MKVLSLFDGMACGMLAMLSAGIQVDRYVAFEIDKYAVQTSSHNFPQIEHRGDVFQADFTEFSGFDFLVGGSPCTYWSIAQKNNRETEASGMGWELFSQYVRALHEAKPTWFIYENNKSMSNAIRESITETFGFEPICINSALVSAQNRQRLYWVGRRNLDGTYSKVKAEQPEDRGILLKDVLDGNLRLPEYGDEDKSRPLNANYSNNCGGWWLRMFNENPNKQQVDMVAQPVGTTDDGKAFCLTSSYQFGCSAQDTISKSRRSLAAEPIRIGLYPNNDGIAEDHQQNRVYSIEGKSVNLCGNGGGMGAKTGLYAIPVEFEGDVPPKAISGSDGKVYPVWEVKDGQITIKGKQYPIKLVDGYYIIRKLTVMECKRLQTVPEWYAFPVSDTQAYKMLGNGWTVAVIAHLIQATQADETEDEQLNLFKMLGVT